MMLLDNQFQMNRKPADSLELYCKSEGLDHLHIRSLARRERNRKALTIAKDIIMICSKWMNRFTMNRQRKEEPYSQTQMSIEKISGRRDQNRDRINFTS